MKLNKQENQIKKKMQSFEPNVDTDMLWGSLAAHVPGKKRRRKAFFWFFVALALVVTSGGSYLYIQSLTEKSTTISSTGNQIDSKKEKLQKIEKTPVQTNTNEFQKQQSAQKAIHQSNSSKEETASINADPVLKQNPVKKNKKWDDVVEERSDKTGSIQQPAKEYEIVKTEVAERSDNVYSPVADPGLIQKPAKENKKWDNVIMEGPGDSGTTISKDRTVKSIPGITSLSDSERKLFNTSFIDNLYPRYLNQPNEMKSISSSLQGTKWDPLTWNIGIGIGGYTDYSFSAENDGDIENSRYLNSISSTLPSVNLDFGISYFPLKKLYLNSGLRFTRMVTRFQVKWAENSVEEIKDQLTGTQTKIRQSEYEALGHNYHYKLDIPLNLGWNVVSSKRWSLGMEIGAILNLLHTSKGFVLDEDNKLLRYSSNSNSPYKSGFDPGFQGSLRLNYRITDDLNLYFKPGISKNKIKYSTQDIEIKEMHRMFHFDIGLVF